MYGADVRAGVLTKLFLSLRIFEDGDEIARMYLIHELSHLHIQDQIGSYKSSRLPFWFKEGLATYASDGGGAHTVTGEASDWGLNHHMFYRQSMLFISYLATINESGSRNFLLGIENDERFFTSLEAAYNKELEKMWDEFLYEVNTKG